MSVCENVTPAILESSNSLGLKPSVLAAPVSPLKPRTPREAQVRGEPHSVLQEPSSAGKRCWVAAIWRELDKQRAAKKTPHIVHVKMDELFASVEQVLNPKLRGKPVLVGRGVVASASCEAQLHGAKTGTNVVDAVHLCPTAVVVPGQYQHYAEFAERVRHILETYTPAVETASLDDFYLDLAASARRYANFEGTLRRLQAEVLGRTGLHVSVGAARSKVLASTASRLERSCGLRIVQPGTEETFLAPLPVEKLQGIGHAYAVALAEQGITTIGQLRRIPKPVLAAAFSDEIGEQIWDCARGLDRRKSSLASASISRETTIEDGTVDRDLLSGLLEYLSERIGVALRERGKQAGTIGVRVRFVDHSCAQQTARLASPTNDEHELLIAAKELFAKLAAQGVAVCRVGVSAANLAGERRENATFGADACRRKYLNREEHRAPGRRYGWDAVLQGS